MNVIKAASPLLLAASKASSILPPTPFSMFATDNGSDDATFKILEGALGELRDFCIPSLCNDDDDDDEENAKVEDAAQPNQRANDAMCII
jgi:hypothetical protein